MQTIIGMIESENWMYATGRDDFPYTGSTPFVSSISMEDADNYNGRSSTPTYVRKRITPKEYYEHETFKAWRRVYERSNPPVAKIVLRKLPVNDLNLSRYYGVKTICERLNMEKKDVLRMLASKLTPIKTIKDSYGIYVKGITLRRLVIARNQEIENEKED